MKKKYYISLSLILFLFSIANAQTYLGNYTNHTISSNSIRIYAGESSIKLSFYSPEIVRVDFLPTKSTKLDTSLVVVQDTLSGVMFNTNITDSTIQISTSSMSIICKKNPLRLSYYNSAGKLLLSDSNIGGFAINNNERLVIFNLNSNTHFYGTGERGTSIDKRNQAFNSYNIPRFGYDTPEPTLNINVPFLSTTDGYGLYFENTYPGYFDLGVSDVNKFWYKSLGGELSYFFILGATIPEQIERYTFLTGRQPLPPKWALGYIQSKYGYQNRTEAENIVQTMRDKKIPCDAIIIDLYWFSQMGDMQWNTSAWNNPNEMINNFLADGMKTILIVEPYIVSLSSNFSEAFSNGYFTKDYSGNPYIMSDWWSCGGCDVGLLDLTNPTVQNWLWNKYLGFWNQNLGGIWTDLGEPERHPSDMWHYSGSADKVHNIYNLLWSKMIFENFNQTYPNKRLFNLTRSGYAGSQRYSVIPWSGDVGTSFGGLAVQLPMLLNMGISGLAYHNSDIGGFCCSTTSPELFVRWMQYGVFCPIVRAHGVGQPQEPWGYGAEAELIIKKYIEFRYQLLPYIYTMAYKNYATGMPIARPIFFDYPDEIWYNESSTYMWGDNILVSPVVEEGQQSKNIRLPPGKWVDMLNDNIYEGNSTINVPTPLDVIPLFVKSGSIIPMQSVMNYTDERSLDTLFLHIYPNIDKEASFSMYEDDGKTLDYQKGNFAITNFTQKINVIGFDLSLILNISATEGNYTGKPMNRTYIAEVHNVSSEPSSVFKNSNLLTKRLSYQEILNNGEGFFYDNSNNKLFVNISTNADSGYTIIAHNIGLDVPLINKDSESVKIELLQNYPNPFSSETMIRYTITRGGEQGTGDNSLIPHHLSPVSCPPLPITLKIYTITGQLVRTLVDDIYSVGNYSVKWDGTNQNGKKVPNGVYIYKLNVGNRYEDIKKMLIIR